MGKSGEKWGKVGISDERRCGKVWKSDEKWGKVGKVT